MKKIKGTFSIEMNLRVARVKKKKKIKPILFAHILIFFLIEPFFTFHISCKTNRIWVRNTALRKYY